MLYTPAGYEATRDGPLPTLLWAYPREYKTAASAAQVAPPRNVGSATSPCQAIWGAPQHLAKQCRERHHTFPSNIGSSTAPCTQPSATLPCKQLCRPSLGYSLQVGSLPWTLNGVLSCSSVPISLDPKPENLNPTPYTLNLKRRQVLEQQRTRWPKP